MYVGGMYIKDNSYNISTRCNCLIIKYIFFIFIFCFLLYKMFVLDVFFDTLVKDQNFYCCFLYSLASVCIVSAILTTIIAFCVCNYLNQNNLLCM